MGLTEPEGLEVETGEVSPSDDPRWTTGTGTRRWTFDRVPSFDLVSVSNGVNKRQRVSRDRE